MNTRSTLARPPRRLGSFAPLLLVGLCLLGCNASITGQADAGGLGGILPGHPDAGGPIPPNALTITTTSLPIGTPGTAYTANLAASGGKTPYQWTVSQGTLPPGLTLSSSGTLSGTPTTRGTSTFTVTVTDATVPALTASAPLSLSVAIVWYVRADGGTRYSEKVPTGQCNGKFDKAYPGSGVNQDCAFGDYRFLYDDQSYGNSAWVISGGDTVIVRGGPWRIGFDQGMTSNDKWCYGGTGTFSCYNPPLPAGTPELHTRILGENYANCTKQTELFGGFGVGTVMNLTGAQYVDVQCLEVTRHSQCIVHGVPAYPSGCQHNSAPIDDYDSDGIITDVNTHDLLLQDLNVHGHTDRGIIGPIGGLVTANRVTVAYNGMAGWDFDDGHSTKLVNAKLKASYLTVEWNGCNQEYPITHAIPAISCYSQSTGGYGDGVGSPAGTGFDVEVDHSIFRYNTQDGIDIGHVDTGVHSLSITNSLAYGNNGQPFKWGANEVRAVFENNISLSNCNRMSAPMPGAPSTYNTNLADFCRAGDGVSFNFRQDGTALFANNTIVSYAPTTLDIGCWDTSCSNSTLTFTNNLVLGYIASFNTAGGDSGGPGGFYFQQPIGHVVRSNNLFYHVRTESAPTGNPGELITDPLFINEPPQFTDEASLDGFNFQLAPGSPARGAGTPVPGLTTNYAGTPVASPPNIGAY